MVVTEGTIYTKERMICYVTTLRYNEIPCVEPLHHHEFFENSCNTAIALTLLFFLARFNGVCPSVDWAETSAPSSFNALIASTSPFFAARCIGVYPYTPAFGEISAPSSFNSLITSTCPFIAARCIGVSPDT